MNARSSMLLGVFVAVLLAGTVIFDAAMLVGLSSEKENGPVVAHPSFAPDGHDVAFWTDWRGRAQIWAVSTVDGRLRPIAADPGVDGIDPAWSPTGSWVAYVSPRAGHWNIWLVRPDGSGHTPLTTGRDRDGQPTWSPDGTEIAFVSYRPPDPGTIWVINANGSGLRRIPASGNHPSFSPDGSQLVFAVREGTANITSHLMIVNADGSGLRQLTTGGFDDRNPSWGRRGILFDSNRFGSWGIKMIQPDGSGLQAIPNVLGARPTWSPDGTKFAFIGGYSIREFNFLNSTIRLLVNLKGFFIPIDILPGVSFKAISLKEPTPIRVAILPAPGLDPVHQIDQTSITFGGTGDEKSLTRCAADGVSLVCHFQTALTGFRPGDTIGILRAMKVDRLPPDGREIRIPLEGRGVVQIVP